MKEKTEEGFTHSENLSQFIDEILKKNRVAYEGLVAVAVSSGPGSYTGLRIGSSTAKGLCYALEIPLIAINTLIIMTDYVKRKHEADLYCPMVDARRMEVFTAMHDGDMTEVVNGGPMILNENSFAEILSTKRVLFFGNGAQKFSEIINNENAIFKFGYQNSAGHMVSLAQEKFKEKDFEDLAYFEPNYLKNFQATIPKEKLKTQ